MTLAAIATLLRIAAGPAVGTNLEHTAELLAAGAIARRRKRHGPRYALTARGEILVAEQRARAHRFDVAFTQAARQMAERRASA